MFRVSCIQLRSNNNIHHNLKRTTILIKKAVLQKTDFILTPEVSSQFSLKKNELFKVLTVAFLWILLSIFLIVKNINFLEKFLHFFILIIAGTILSKSILKITKFDNPKWSFN